MYTHTHTHTKHTISTEVICQLWNDCVTGVMTSNLQASHGLHWILHLRHNFTAKRDIIRLYKQISYNNKIYEKYFGILLITHTYLTPSN